jgi:hypothetical protein
MDNLISKLTELKKALKNATVLPSPKPPKIPTAPKIDSPNNIPKQPTLTPTSQKDPMKQAQQVQDPSTKIQAVKMAKEKIKLSKNGQWELESEPMDKGLKSLAVGAALTAGSLIGGQAKAEMKINKPISKHYMQNALSDKTASDAMTSMFSAGGHILTVSHDNKTGRMQLNLHHKNGGVMGVISDDGDYSIPTQRMTPESSYAIRNNIDSISEHFKNYVSKVNSGAFNKPTPAK